MQAGRTYFWKVRKCSPKKISYDTQTVSSSWKIDSDNIQYEYKDVYLILY